MKQCLKTDYFLSFVVVGYRQPLPGKPERQNQNKTQWSLSLSLGNFFNLMTHYEGIYSMSECLFC